jgi:hypothetical protein
VRRLAVELGLQAEGGGRGDDHLPDGRRVVEDEPEGRAQPRGVEALGSRQGVLLGDREQQLEPERGALHHDPDSFEHPYRFDPDRWSPERTGEIPKGAFVPFGAGARQCVGNLFAQTEIVTTVATVAARWRLVPVPGKPVRVKFTSAAYPSGMLMTAVPRN